MRKFQLPIKLFNAVLQRSEKQQYIGKFVTQTFRQTFRRYFRRSVCLSLYKNLSILPIDFLLFALFS